MDDVIIFDRALNDYEIRELYGNQSSRHFVNDYANLNGYNTFRAYTQDRAGNVNSTEERSVIIEYSTSIDVFDKEEDDISVEEGPAQETSYKIINIILTPKGKCPVKLLGKTEKEVYKEIHLLWNKLYDISVINHKKGTPYISFFKGIKFIFDSLWNFRKLSKWEKELQ